MKFKLAEMRKEEDTYYQGAFWIIGNSVEEILAGKYELECVKLDCDYYGNYIVPPISHRALSHERLWEEKIKFKYGESIPFNYYPRGRVGVSNGKAYINLYFDSRDIRSKIIKEYELEKLDTIIFKPEEYNEGSHYSFLLPYTTNKDNEK